jgi:hypothetical protein
VTGDFGGRSVPFSRTCTEASSGTYVAAGSSSLTFPASTSCMTAADVTGLVMDAMAKIASGLAPRAPR